MWRPSSSRHQCSPTLTHPAQRFSPVIPPTTQWGMCCPTMAQSDLLRLPPEPSIQQNRSTLWGRERPWPVSGLVSGGICMCMAVHSHYERTTKHSLARNVWLWAQASAHPLVVQATSPVQFHTTVQSGMRECGGGLTVTLHATSSCGPESSSSTPLWRQQYHLKSSNRPLKRTQSSHSSHSSALSSTSKATSALSR